MKLNNIYYIIKYMRKRLQFIGGDIINLDILIENCTVITMDKMRRVLKNTCIGVIGDKIVYLGDFNDNLNAVKVIKGSSMLAVPGLIDSHAHSGHGLLKNVEECVMNRKIIDLYPNLFYEYTTQKFWFSEAMLSGIEKLKFGITTGVSFLGSHMRFDELVYAEAHVEGMLGVGIRDIMCLSPPNPPYPKRFSKWNDMQMLDTNQLLLEDSINYIEMAVKRFNRVNSEFTFCYPSTSFIGNGNENSTEETKIYKFIKNLADEYGTYIHSHSYKGEIKYVYENFKFYNEKVFISNCNDISSEEIKILSDLGVSYCISPFLEMQSMRYSPVVKLLNEGVNTTLCTEVNNSDCTFDLFEKARMRVLMGRSYSNNNYAIQPDKALEMITINAAKALGLDNMIGSIEIGKKADITLIDIEKPHLYPLWQNPINLIYQVSGHDVDTVIVDGRVLMEKRILTQLNEKKILNSAQNEAQKVLLREGVKEYLELLTV